MGGFRLCVAGASIGNGNRGVEALGRSTLDMIDALAPGSRVSAFDDGWGVRPDTSGRYQASDVEYVGVRLSRRWHRPESWAQIAITQALTGRLLRGRPNPVARRIATSDAVLDISGGDSFTDMYGPVRLRSIAAPKEAALRARRPLILLPQTYGPFDTASGRSCAHRLIRGASLAYARDPDSYARLLELAGPNADHSRLRDGVDVAFALTPRRPADEVADRLEAVADDRPVAGVNISGLLRHGYEGSNRFRLVGDYVGTMATLIDELVDRGAAVLAVPHVHTMNGAGESDIAAIAQALDRLPDAVRSAVTVLPPTLDAAELKWCIARCDWFVGSRMHSTIGALSSYVPAFGYAYSVKTRGVFETCGMGAHVLDARQVAGRAAVEAMIASYDSRDATRAHLAAAVPAVVDRARGQMSELLSDVDGWRASPHRWEAIA